MSTGSKFPQFLSGKWESLFLLHIYRIFWRVLNSRLVGFFLSQYFKYFTPLCPCLRGFWKVWYNFYLCFSRGKIFPTSSLRIIFFIFDFLSFEYDTPSYCFWHVFCLMFFELSESVVWYLTLTWENSHSCFKYFFCFFLFSPSDIPFAVVHSLWIFCSVLGFFQSDYFCWYSLKLRDSFLSCVQPTHKPIKKAFFISVTVFWSLAFIFLYF